ncbi:MAG: hypothetical protein Q8Q92_03475 [bacterium]|nr:hypothetical protein [bacterium]
MYVRLSRLRKVVGEQAQHLFEQLKEDSDRLRRGIQDNWPGENHNRFEEDFEFEAKEKDEEEPEADVGEDNPKEKPAFLKGKGKDEPKKKSPPEEDSAEEEEPKKEPSPKHKKAKKGLEKAQKQKKMPKSQVDPSTGVKQDVDLDALAQLATEMGYRLERNDPEPELDLGLDPESDLGDFPGDDDEMDFSGLDTEKEDVALFSSDEDLEDVLGLDNEEPETGLEGHPLSLKHASPVAKQGAAKSGGLKLHVRK